MGNRWKEGWWQVMNATLNDEISWEQQRRIVTQVSGVRLSNENVEATLQLLRSMLAAAKVEHRAEKEAVPDRAESPA